MLVKNRLRLILQEMGIKSMVPTAALRHEQLHGMTTHRFNQIMSNDSKTELSALEIEDIKAWLSQITGQPAPSIPLVEERAAAL